MTFAREQGWQPVAFFAQGVIYLSPKDADVPDRESLPKLVRRCKILLKMI